VTHAAGVMRVVLWTLGALERACVCGHVTMHSLHLSSCRTSASKLLRDRVPLLLECVCAVSLCTCACHCIHFQMPITAFTQQQCMCEGRSARKKCQKKRGGLPIRQRRIQASTLFIPKFLESVAHRTKEPLAQEKATLSLRTLVLQPCNHLQPCGRLVTQSSTTNSKAYPVLPYTGDKRACIGPPT
jgi:hypothetical protein